MNKTVKVLIKSLVFVLILGACFFFTQNVLSGGSDKKDKQKMYSFFDEREDSLDVVFLGSSTTYATWTAPVAWDEYGIATYSLSNAAQPIFAAKFLIDDARKTQPDALYVINISHFLLDYENYLFKLLDSYPFTLNKLKMTAYLCDFADFSLSDSMEYFFPIIRFHDRWTEIKKNDFEDVPEDEFKSASYYGSFLKKKTDVGAIQADFETYEELDEKTLEALYDLINYCKEEEVKVLFMNIPQGIKVTGRAGKQNTTIKILEEEGFDVLDLREYIDEMGLDAKNDFYNKNHLNIHGSLKATHFISQYLIEKYGFEDKRGQEEYSDWDLAVRKYYSYIKNYLSGIDLQYVDLDTERKTEEVSKSQSSIEASDGKAD